MRRIALSIACLMVLLLVSSCGSGPAGSECGGWKPIRVSRGDALTDPTARAVLAHNEHGRERCGW